MVSPAILNMLREAERHALCAAQAARSAGEALEEARAHALSDDPEVVERLLDARSVVNAAATVLDHAGDLGGRLGERT